MLLLGDYCFVTKEIEMNLTISYRHMDGTPAIESKIRQKAEHLKKYFNGKIDISWVCTVDNNLQRSEVNIYAGKNHLYAKSEHENLYKTFDLVLDKIERQTRKKKNIQKNNIHSKFKVPATSL